MSKYDVTEERNLYIGGSDIPIIMGLSPFKTRWQLLCEKSGKEVSGFGGNDYTEYGHIMEPKIRGYINETYNANYEEDRAIDGDLRYHADGRDKASNKVLEIKTTSHIFPTIDGYKHYLVQLMFGMMMHKSGAGVLAVYERPEDFSEDYNPFRLSIFEVKFDEELALEINEAIDSFRRDWQRLKENPFLDEVDLLPAEIGEYAEQIAVIENELQRIKNLETESKNLKQRLLKAMESRGIKSWTTPQGTKVTYVAATPDKSKTTLNVDALIKAHPELLEDYGIEKVTCGKSSYVRITPKKGGEQ